MSTSASRGGRSHDAPRTRTAILNAAEVVFAEHGFHGARIDAIAAEAAYNKSLIFQYFGDKLGLYAEVLKRADHQASDLRTRIFAPLLAEPTIASDAYRLRLFFEMAFQALFDHLLAHPRLLRIILWEMADGWRTYTQISVPQQVAQADPLALLFAQAQHAGLIRSSFVPAVQLTLALQMCQSYLACLPLYQVLLPQEALASTAGLAQARQYIVAFIVAGIMVDSPSVQQHQPAS